MVELVIMIYVIFPFQINALSFYLTKTVLVGPKWFWSDQIDLYLTVLVKLVIFTLFKCVQLSTVVSLYGLHLIAAPSTVK